MSTMASAAAQMAAQNRCCGPNQLTASNKYRAQWVYFTPQGYRDEPFEVAFSFTVAQNGAIQRGFPTQLDDDAPFIWRGFSSASLIGLGLGCLYDAYGNPLMAGLAYNWGGLGFGTFAWPMESELYCQPGAVLLMDLQLRNLGGNATISGTYLGVKRRPVC